ncbi:MAG TPA: hypothetical protein VFX31_07755 [Ktedonobacterales bacterium]|nr:hypothetical protein [Ktedonobacterales bacterium]HEX5571264.1 hypothetical protein [Ktedonobacterales bacterium]
MNERSCAHYPIRTPNLSCGANGVKPTGASVIVGQAATEQGR